MTHFKRILAVGVACTALMMTHSAKAQDELDKSSHFYPAKAWQVGSIKAVSDYSGECIIQTEFNNGFLLQINGSSNWVQQLNLNIRQSAFVVGNHYDVSLRVPGHEEAVINSVAHRDNIISVPMKGQKELFKAIRDNGVLDIAIEGHQFRFFLTRFIEAANKFERCMAGGAPGVVAAKNIRDDDTLEAIKNPDISVSSESLSEAEKAFLVNESIAFEQQEVQSKDVSVAKPAVEEEDAVAALNASAVEAMSLQNNKPPARAPKADDLEPIEPQSMSVVPEAGTAFEDEPFTPEPVIVNAVREVSPEPIVVVMDPPVEQVVDVEEVAVVAPNAAPNKAPEEAAVERTPNPTPAPTMPKSDMLAAESFLSQP